MHENFFDHVNIRPREHPHPATARCRATRSTSTAAAYERAIRRGRRHRHADPRHRPDRPHRLQRARVRAGARTRLVTLDPVTRRDAAGDFFGEENVPHEAITMGVGDHPRGARDRADGLRRAQGGDRAHGRRRRAVDRDVAASFLQGHPERDRAPRPRRRGRADAHPDARGCWAPWTGPRPLTDAGGRLARARQRQGAAQARRRTTSATTTCTRCSRSTARPGPLNGAVFNRLQRQDPRPQPSCRREPARPGLQPAPGRRRDLHGRDPAQAASSTRTPSTSPT